MIAATRSLRRLLGLEMTREELLEMVAKQSSTIHFLRMQIEEALTAIDNEAPDLAWRKLLNVRESFRHEEDLSDCYDTIKGQR